MPAGYWIWHDSAGWHLRVTHTGKTRLDFTGVVRTTNPATSHRVLAESRDRLVRSADRRTTSFRLTNYGGVDGFDLKAGCSATVSFALFAGGRPVAPAAIHLGDDDAHPASSRFSVTRVPTA